MSSQNNSREGLSPSPINILDIFTEDEEDDDVDSYHPTEEQSTNASETQDDDDSDAAFAGNLYRIPKLRLMSADDLLDAQETLSGIEIVFETSGDEEGDQTETENGAGGAATRPAQGLCLCSTTSHALFILF